MLAKTSNAYVDEIPVNYYHHNSIHVMYISCLFVFAAQVSVLENMGHMGGISRKTTVQKSTQSMNQIIFSSVSIHSCTHNRVAPRQGNKCPSLTSESPERVWLCNLIPMFCLGWCFAFLSLFYSLIFPCITLNFTVCSPGCCIVCVCGCPAAVGSREVYLLLRLDHADTGEKRPILRTGKCEYISDIVIINISRVKAESPAFHASVQTAAGTSWLVGMLLGAVEMFHYYGFYLSSSFLMYNFMSFQGK